MLQKFFAKGKKPAARSTATVENLESRKLLAASPVGLFGIKIAKRVDTDGTSLNSNRITVAFSNPDGTLAALRIRDQTAFRSFGYANDLLNPGQQRKATVGMTITYDQTGVLTIVTDRLVRKGSRLQILQGALQDRFGNDIVFDASTDAKTITFGVGQNKPRYTMSNRIWRPTDLSYFSPDIFTGAPTPTTANTSPSAASVRVQLAAFMNQKVAAGRITQTQANTSLSIYDNFAANVPTPTLRAAMASLIGTVGEPAIDSYLGKSNLTGKAYSFIDFDSSISSGAPVGETRVNSGGRLTLVVRPTFAGEDFRALSAVLAHESIHQDTLANVGTNGITPSSQDEEIIANAVQVNVYAQQILVNNAFVANKTKLVNTLNDQMLATLNSGDRLFPYGGINQAPALTNNGNVFIGARTDPGNYGNNTTVKSFEDFIRREYIFRGFSAGSTAGNPTASAILKNIVGTNTNTTTLGSTVQRYLDTQNAILTDVVYIKMAEALKLTF